MTRLSAWKRACAIFLLCAATGIAAPAEVFKPVLNFDVVNGASPVYVRLAQGADGNLYGTTSAGGSGTGCAGGGCGTVFKITPAGTLTTLYSFCTQTNCTDGAQPFAGLLLATDGNFYGTTQFGGTNDRGTVFKITSAGVLTTLHSFAGFDGARPYAGVIQSSDGNFYGTTFGGDINSDYGTVFKITPSGLLTTLHSFSNSDGAYPIAGLIQGSDGNFYGSTSGGGSSDECKSYGCGTVFKLTVGGALTTLTLRYAEGAYPTGTLIQGNDGNYYGTSVAGGNRNCNAPDGCGTIFKITPEVTLMTVHTFDDGDGSAPYAGLLQATDGNFYGATAYGAIGYGTLFQLTPESTLTTLVGFTYADGSSPLGALVQDTSGNFYGTATGGGSSNDCGVNGCGTVFMLNMGLGPFAAFVRPYGKVGQTGGILGQGFTGTTSVSINGIRANFKVVSDTFIRATVPPGATTGYVTVVTTSVTLTSNVPFRVLQ